MSAMLERLKAVHKLAFTRGAFVWLAVAATLWIVADVRAAAPASTWAQAQARESEVLQSELDALRKGLSTNRASTQTAKASLRKEIDDLSMQLSRLQVKGATLEESLPARERSRSRSAQTRQLDDLLARLRTRTNASPTLDEDPDAAAQALPNLVTQALAQIRSDASLRVVPDTSYFDAQGQLRTASVLFVGGVAAIRWDDPLALVATPEGLRATSGLPTTRIETDEGTLANALLFDPKAPPPPLDYAKAGWRTRMDAGGPIMWMLAAIGLVAALIVLERAMGLIWARMRWRREQRRFERAVKEQRTASLLHVTSWIAKPLVIAAGARCPSCTTPTETDAEEGATQALMVMRERLQRRLSLVNVTAGVAPLLGLLGTVTGMIHTFTVVTSTGTSEPQQLAAGISEALLTTQFGLAIAIPAFLAHALLSRGARRILASAEQSVLWYLHGADPIAHALHAHDHEHDHDQGHGHAHHHHDHHHKPSSQMKHDVDHGDADHDDARHG